MTLRELISTIKTAIKEAGADSRLFNRFVLSKVFNVSNLLVQREADSLKLSGLFNIYQTLKCFPVDIAPTIDDCCGVKNFCNVYRTKRKLPEFYEDSDGFIHKNITSIDNSTKFVMISPQSIIRKKRDLINNKYDKTVYCFYRDGYLYFTGKIKAVNIEAMFMYDIESLNNCNCFPGNVSNKNCVKFLDTRWYVPKKLEHPIIQETIKQIMITYKAIKEDVNINKNPS